MDEAAAAAAHWGAEPVMSDMEALMWRSEASPRLRSGGVILDVLDRAPDWDRLEASHLWAVTRVPRLRERVIEDPLRVTPPAWAGTEEFDLAYHLRRARLPEGGTFDDVLAAAQVLAMAPFDRARPLWEARPDRGPAGRPGGVPAQAPPLAARRRRGHPAVRHPAQRAARPHAGEARGRRARRSPSRRPPCASGG